MVVVVMGTTVLRIVIIDIRLAAIAEGIISKVIQVALGARVVARAQWQVEACDGRYRVTFDRMALVQQQRNDAKVLRQHLEARQQSRHRIRRRCLMLRLRLLLLLLLLHQHCW